MSEMNHQISEITHANLRQQMNPHFIFNTLNSIQYYMYQHDKLATNNYLTKFSSLIRKILENSQIPFITIKDELERTIKQSNYGWLFKGQKEGTHLSTRSIQQIIKRAAKQANISKGVHPHTLRHSFATHLIENGSDVVQVQSLLGHASPETSMIYVHTARPKMINVTSPLDVIIA